MNTAAHDTYLTTHREGGTCVVTLGAPPAHALSLGMIRALQSTLDALAEDDSAKVVLFAGGQRVFCAGHDMKEIRRHRGDEDDGRAYLDVLFAECSAMMIALARLPKPTIAVVEGVATAGGLQLMSSCDLVFAGDTARFCLPGVNNGGFCSTPSVAVGRRIARAHLMEMSLSGEMFDAAWAERTGLVNRIVPAGQAMQAAEAFAQTLATRHAPAIATGKAGLDAQLGLRLEEAYAVATPVMLGHFMDPHRIAKDRG
jgi:enoyl-CoA hydratase/carnithine racemase